MTPRHAEPVATVVLAREDTGHACDLHDETHRVWHTLEQARRRDPIGHVVHAALGATYVFLLPLATAPKDWAFGVLLGYAILRLPSTWPCYRALRRDPLIALLLIWGLWQALSILWSDDRLEGLDELKAMRVLLTPLMLWPVIDQAPWLIGSMLGGVFAQNVVQALQQLEWFGLRPAENLRLRGLLHPIHTGAFCTAAMLWHGSWLLHARGPMPWRALRVIATIIGLAAAGFGLVFSGSRGPWLALLVAMPAMLVVLACRRPSVRRRAIWLAAIAVVVALASWPWTGAFIMHRVDQAVAGLQAGWRGGVGDDAQRIVNWTYAWQAFETAPVVGVGAGGYKIAARASPRYQALAAADPQAAELSLMPHPHSVYLYLLACTGLVGLACFLSVTGVLLVRGWRDPPDHRYADATLFVLISWLIGALLDCHNLNGNIFGLVGVVAAVTMRHRPAPGRLRSATPVHRSDAAAPLA